MRWGALIFADFRKELRRTLAQNQEPVASHPLWTLRGDHGWIIRIHGDLYAARATLATHSAILPL